MQFVFSDTVVDFPEKSHKIILVRPLCLGRNCDKYLQNDPLEDPPEFHIIQFPSVRNRLCPFRLQAPRLPFAPNISWLRMLLI